MELGVAEAGFELRQKRRERHGPGGKLHARGHKRRRQPEGREHKKRRRELDRAVRRLCMCGVVHVAAEGGEVEHGRPVQKARPHGPVAHDGAARFCEQKEKKHERGAQADGKKGEDGGPRPAAEDGRAQKRPERLSDQKGSGDDAHKAASVGGRAHVARNAGVDGDHRRYAARLDAPEQKEHPVRPRLREADAGANVHEKTGDDGRAAAERIGKVRRERGRNALAEKVRHQGEIDHLQCLVELLRNHWERRVVDGVGDGAPETDQGQKNKQEQAAAVREDSIRRLRFRRVGHVVGHEVGGDLFSSAFENMHYARLTVTAVDLHGRVWRLWRLWRLGPTVAAIQSFFRLLLFLAVPAFDVQRSEALFSCQKSWFGKSGRMVWSPRTMHRRCV